MRVGGPPGDVGGDVTVLVEGSEGDEGSPDVPDIDSKVNTESAAAQIVSSLRSPLYSIVINIIIKQRCIAIIQYYTVFYLPVMTAYILLDIPYIYFPHWHLLSFY